MHTLMYIPTQQTAVHPNKGKYKQIREILEPLPERRFDPSTVRVPYVSGFGTAYVEAYEQVIHAASCTLRPSRRKLRK